MQIFSDRFSMFKREEADKTKTHPFECELRRTRQFGWPVTGSKSKAYRCDEMRMVKVEGV